MKELKKDPNELLKELEITDVPDITRISKKYGINIKIGNVTDSVIDTKLERAIGNIKGIIVINDTKLINKRSIMIDSQYTPTTKRFIAAYLFSSYQINGEKGKEFMDIIYDESIYDKTVYDYTLDLLMPDYLFDKEMQITDKNLLAKKYNVSEFLIEKKLEKKLKENK